MSGVWLMLSRSLTMRLTDMTQRSRRDSNFVSLFRRALFHPLLLVPQPAARAARAS